MDCERCHGFGYIAIFHGDNDIECPTCKGTCVQQDTAPTGAGDEIHDLWRDYNQQAIGLSLVPLGFTDYLLARLKSEEEMSSMLKEDTYAQQTELASLRSQVAALTSVFNLIDRQLDTMIFNLEQDYNTPTERVVAALKLIKRHLKVQS